MSSQDVLCLKQEIEHYEQTLTELLKQWDDDAKLKCLAKPEQVVVLRSVASAKSQLSLLISKIKFKIDLLQRTPGDRRLWGITMDEWNEMKPKIETIHKNFETLGSGMKAEYPTREQKERDLRLSKNIEESLRKKRLHGKDQFETFSSASVEDGRGDVGKKVGRGNVDASRNLGIGDAPSAVDADDYDRKLVENVKNFKEQLTKARSRETISEIVDDVCPEVAASVKQHIKSLVASQTITDDDLSREMLDEIRGIESDDEDFGRDRRKERLLKSKEIREERIKKLEKLSEVEPLQTRPALPSPLPIDGFLDMVETLPGEIQKLVLEETESLSDYYKEQHFSKTQPLSSRHGRLVSLDRLKPEYQDERFDTSDFHLRVPESAIAQKTLKDHLVDNAVGRYFGTFSSPSASIEAQSGSPHLEEYEDDEMNLSFSNLM